MSWLWGKSELASQPNRECVCICINSPARLLAKSLTDPETRGEWTSEWQLSGYSAACIYNNASRGLIVTRFMDTISTPFTLNEAEKALVKDATKAFDKRLSDEREAAAFARLTAPKPPKSKPTKRKS